MPWSTEQVLGLAPDPAAAQAGRGLASESKWVSLGADDACVWGEAKGSAAQPYQTCIDLSEPAFKCNCPSRKFPCKHGLGLFLLFAEGKCRRGNRPQWVDEWLGKRAEKSAVKAAKPKVEVDPEAQAKRAAKREDRVAAGVADCEVWLRDLIRTGFASPSLSTPRTFEGVAARLVDAQAPGLARMVRRMGDAVSAGPGWEGRLLERAGALYLLLQAHARMAELPQDLQDDVRQAIGWTVKKEDLPKDAEVTDHWTVLGQATWTEDRITTQRSWIYGAGSQRWAMVLAFSVAGSPFEISLVPGTGFDGRVAYHPSAYPLRAQVLERAGAAPFPPPPKSIAECLDHFAAGLASNPWTDSAPFAIAEATLGKNCGRWLLIQARHALPIAASFSPWQLLALSGGQPTSIFGEWDGHTFRPLSAQTEAGFCRL